MTRGKTVDDGTDLLNNPPTSPLKQMKDERELLEGLYRALEVVQDCIQTSKINLRLEKEYVENIREQKTNDKSWRKAVRKCIKKARKIRLETEEANRVLIEQEAPEHVRKILQTKRRRNVLAIKRYVEMFNHPDKKLWERVLHGFPSLGSGDKTGVWEEREGAAEISAEDVKDFYQACISLRQLKPNFEDRLLDAVISEIESDAELGRLTEISVEELRAVPAYAFPKEEATKVRVIIDARFHNQWANLTERLTLYGTRWITQTIALYGAPCGEEGKAIPAPQTRREAHASMAERLQEVKKARDDVAKGGEAKKRISRERAAHEAETQLRTLIAEIRRKTETLTAASEAAPGVIPEMGSDDFSKAYYLLGVESPHDLPVGAWDNKAPGPHGAGSYRYWVSNVLQMGSVRSVPDFCRISELVMTIMIRSHVPCLAYIDDVNYFGATRRQIRLCKELYHEVAETLGLELSPKEGADQSSDRTSHVKALGVHYHWNRDLGTLKISVPEDKKERAIETLEELDREVIAKNVNPKTVQRAIGIGQWVTTAAVWRKIGAEPWRNFYPWTVPGKYFDSLKADGKARASLRKAIGVARTLVKELEPTVISPGSWKNQRTCFLWSDASTDGGPAGEPMLGGLLIDHRGRGSQSVRKSAQGGRTGEMRGTRPDRNARNAGRSDSAGVLGAGSRGKHGLWQRRQRYAAIRKHKNQRKIPAGRRRSRVNVGKNGKGENNALVAVREHALEHSRFLHEE